MNIIMPKPDELITKHLPRIMKEVGPEHQQEVKRLIREHNIRTVGALIGRLKENNIPVPSFLREGEKAALPKELTRRLEKAGLGRKHHSIIGEAIDRFIDWGVVGYPSRIRELIFDYAQRRGAPINDNVKAILSTRKIIGMFPEEHINAIRNYLLSIAPKGIKEKAEYYTDVVALEEEVKKHIEEKRGKKPKNAWEVEIAKARRKDAQRIEKLIKEKSAEIKENHGEETLEFVKAHIESKELTPHKKGLAYRRASEYLKDGKKPDDAVLQILDELDRLEEVPKKKFMGVIDGMINDVLNKHQDLGNVAKRVIKRHLLDEYREALNGTEYMIIHHDPEETRRNIEANIYRADAQDRIVAKLAQKYPMLLRDTRSRDKFAETLARIVVEQTFDHLLTDEEIDELAKKCEKEMT